MTTTNQKKPLSAWQGLLSLAFYLTRGDYEVGVVVVDGGVLAGGDTLDAHVGEDGDASKAEAGNTILATLSQYITEIVLPREQKLRNLLSRENNNY